MLMPIKFGIKIVERLVFLKYCLYICIDGRLSLSKIAPSKVRPLIIFMAKIS